MVQPVAVAADLRTALAGAYGAAARSRAVGTEHLLLGVVTATDRGPVAPVLSATALTRPVVATVLRRHATAPGDWRHDDGGGTDQPAPEALDGLAAYKSKTYTGAARAALHRAFAIAAEQGDAEVGARHLLLGLLASDRSRAAQLLHECGVAPDRLRAGLAAADQATIQDDPVAPELRPTRDALLGTARYPARSVSNRLGSAMLRALAVNLAELPVVWMDLDARDQARRLGVRRPGTEHLLLAILATHEVLRDYPHLRPGDFDRRYAGGRVLAAAGVAYRAARDAAEHGADRLGGDARRTSLYSRRFRRYGASIGTGELLLQVLTWDDSRGANLLRLLGVPPAPIRTRLRPP